jgi:putative membrane protein
MTISMAGLPAFLIYFCVGFALIAGFGAVYLRLTAHNEVALIRSGNLSAAIALGGNLVGFSVPLEKAIEQAASIPDLVIWAVIAMVIQFGAYGFARVVIPDLSRKIEEDRIPSAAMLAVIAVLSGTLAAASMTE